MSLKPGCPKAVRLQWWVQETTASRLFACRGRGTTRSSMPPAPPVALAKKSEKGIEVVAVRPGLDHVGLRSPGKSGERRSSARSPRLEVPPHDGVSRVYEHFSACFRIAEPHEAGGGPATFARVGRADRDQVVLTGSPPECLLVARAEEVADREHDRPPPLDLHDVVERDAQVGTRLLWFVRQDIPKQTEDVSG